MQYLLMIYQNEAEYANMRPAAGQQMTAEYQTFTQGIIQSGNFKAGDRLQPTTTATTVRVRDGKTSDDRRPVCRNARAARRLLPRGGQGSRYRDRDCIADSVGAYRFDRGAADLGLRQVTAQPRIGA